MKYSETLIMQGSNLMYGTSVMEGTVSWECPSNIALIKYWGKRKPQMALNSSLSFTLKDSLTRTSVEYTYDRNIDRIGVSFYFSGQPMPEFAIRIEHYLNSILKYMPFLSSCNLTIRSDNTFPHSSGIASSASSYGALALCLVEIEHILYGIKVEVNQFCQKASFLARLGSGSACRSVFGGTVVWGEIAGLEDSCSEYAIPINTNIDPVFHDYCDTILLIDKNEKKVSSSLGHELMNKNPYAKVRIDQARVQLHELYEIMKTGDLEKFVELVEYEALSLHAMMMTSFPGYTLLKAETLEAIEEIRNFRKNNKLPVAFTIDAGANLHILYPDRYKDRIVEELIIHNLSSLCVDGQYINDQVGKGPVNLRKA